MAVSNRRVVAEEKQKVAAKGTKGDKTQKVQSTSLVKSNTSTQVALNNQFASVLEEDAGAGSENLERQDLAIPRISIIQSNSPQVKKAEGKFIKGAEEGDFLDTVTNEVFAKGDVGLLFIPAFYRRTDIEWIPRKKGGGFVADHGGNSDILSKTEKDEETGAMLLPNGNEVVTTAEYIGIALNADGTNPRSVAISLAKTQLKKARKVNTVLTTLQVPRANGQGTFNPAFFYSAFLVTSIPEQSKGGDAYMGWSLVREHNTVDLPEGTDLYLTAKALRESITAGTIKVAQPSDIAADHGGDDDSSL